MMFFFQSVYTSSILLRNETCSVPRYVESFFWGGGGLKESVCQIFFSNTVLDRKWGISILDHYQDFFSSFYLYRFWAVRKWFHNALNSIFALRLFSDWFASSVNVIIVQYIMRLNGTHWSEVMNTLTIIVFILKGVGHLLSMIRNTR